MTLPTLQELREVHGFTSGELTTDGYVACIPAFQKIYFADGNAVSTVNYGFHKLDMINTKIVGSATGTFTQGDIVSQATASAKGIYDEVYGTSTAASAVHLIYRTSTNEFVSTEAIVNSAGTASVTPAPRQEVQRIWPNEVATSGTWTLTYNGIATSAINYNGTTAAIQSALAVGSVIASTACLVGGSTFDLGTGGISVVFATSVGDASPITITPALSGAGGAISCYVSEATKGWKSVQTPPFWMNWLVTTATGTLSVPLSAGSNIGCLYSGRIVLNSMQQPGQWYMSAQGDPLDWDTSQDDIGAAITSQSSQYGKVGDAITCFIPYQDHYLIMGCTNQVWVLRGDPKAGGTITNLSMSTGIFGPEAFCWDDKHNLYFMGMDGLYSLPAGYAVNAQPPINLTSEKVPSLAKELALNRRTDRVVMGFDKQRQGVCVTVVQKDGAWSACFWYDLRTGGIFPEEYIDESIPASMLYYDSRRDDYRGLLLGGQDGYIRRFSDTTKGDETTASTETSQGLSAIDSYVTLGPIGNDKDVRGQYRMNDMAIRLGTTTDTVAYKVYGENTAEGTVDAIQTGTAYQASGTITVGNRAPAIRQKSRGAVMAVQLRNAVSGESWNMEKIQVNLTPAGRVR